MSQKKVLDFITAYIKEHGHSPTTNEIAQGIGISSRGVVHRYLRALESNNLITLLPHRHRNISLVELEHSAPAANDLKLVGSIAAGQPIEAIVDQDPINLADLFLGDNRYALRVKGDSMIDEGIFDGDIVVCEHANTARNGQIVVALIDNQQATLKRFYHEGNNATITLMPANQTLKPMRYPAERVTVQGIYIGLLRIAM